MPTLSRIAGQCKNRGYRPPGWFTTNVFNRGVAALTRVGIGVAGSRVLELRGRKSGEPRRTPVLDSKRYLVAPRGDTQGVRNLRADGELRRVAADHPIFRTEARA